MGGPDLQVTSHGLDELVAALAGFSGQLAEACSDLVAGDGHVSGGDPLAGRVHGFASSWHYGIGQLRQHGSDCVKMLHTVGAAFDHLDAHLAAELHQGKGKK